MDWGPAPPSPALLYQQYDNDTAAAAVQTLRQIRAAEPAITAALQDAVARTAGARMTDELLASRVKSPKSLARKIAGKVRDRPGLTPTAAAGRLTDIVRHTVVADRHNDLASIASAVVVQAVERSGWTVMEAEQSYVEGHPYKGLHLLMRPPDGPVVEVQVHSAASQQIKDRMHADVELERERSHPIVARAAARTRMVAAWSTLPKPPGLDELVLGGAKVVEKHYPNRTKTSRKEGRTISFYLVQDPDDGNEVWLAWEDLDNVRIYAYVPNLGAFVRHDSLANDFYWDMEMKYRPVGTDRAGQIVADGVVGKLDARTHQKAVLDFFGKVTDRKEPAELLGSVLVVRMSPRQAAKARADRVLKGAAR